MGKTEISSVKNWKEAFWETALCSVNSGHRLRAFSYRSLSLRLFLWNLQTDISNPFEDYRAKVNILRWILERSFLRNFFVICEFISQSCSFPLKKPFAKTVSCGICKPIFGSTWRATVKREISSEENWKEAFWETALCSVNSSHRVILCPSRSRTLRLFLWNLQRDFGKPLEAYGEEENILRWKLERSFLRNCFVMCYFHSLSYSFISWICFLALFLCNLWTDISDPYEDYRAKGNILRWKWERSILRNLFEICEFLSQSYSFPLKKNFAKTVLVEFAKWYLEAHGGLWWKGKYPQMKTG